MIKEDFGLFPILMTQKSTFIIGQVATILGYIMEFIFNVLEKIGLPNIGVAIIIFTIVIYTLMIPMTVKQQKFSKLSSIMNPEIQAIQKKYKNKKDNDSMMKMNNETQAVYAKYGVSPMGSCGQLLIQMPILFALYAVIGAIPAYISQVKEVFLPVVTKLMNEAGGIEFVQSFKNAAMYSKQFSNELFVAGDTTYVQNTLIDVLNKASSAEWSSLVEKFPGLANEVASATASLAEYNNFLGLNIGDSPSYLLSMGWADKNFLIIIGALAIPLLSALTQWLNTKLMPQPDSSNDSGNSMAQSMKTMNTMMPLMSAFFCFSLPAGMGLYWIASAVVRGVQQVAINKYIDKMDLAKLVSGNAEKAQAKQEKRIERMKKAGVDSETINKYSNMSLKNVQSPVKGNTTVGEAVKKASEVQAQTRKEEAASKTENSKSGKSGKSGGGSIAARANMVKNYNENNNKK